MPEPTPPEWQALYAAAAAFYDRAPWRWLTDTDLFAVAHPSFAETGYCVVLGGGAQEFGLAVFLGAASFAAYRRLQLPVDANRLRRLRARTPRGQETWCVEVCLLPTPIREGERPYLPCWVLVTTLDGLVLGSELLPPWTTAAERQAWLLAQLERAPALPRQIYVQRPLVEQVVASLAAGLRIGLRVGPLPVVEELKASFLAYLDRR